MGGCGSKPKPPADAEQAEQAPISSGAQPSDAAVPASARSPSVAAPPAPVDGEPKPLLKTESTRSTRQGPLKMLTSRVGTNRTTATPPGGRGNMVGRLLGGAGATSQATASQRGAAPEEQMDGSKRMPTVHDMSPNTTVGCYLVAFGVLAAAFLLCMLQMRMDFELAKKWEPMQCTVVETPTISRLERTHGGNVCVDVVVEPLTGHKDYTVTLNGSPQVTWFPEEDELNREAEKIFNSYQQGATVNCFLSHSKRYMKLEGNWRHEHEGCKSGTFDLVYQPYVIFVMALIAITVFRLTNYVELQDAWAASDAPGTLPDISGPTPDFMQKDVWATELDQNRRSVPEGP